MKKTCYELTVMFQKPYKKQENDSYNYVCFVRIKGDNPDKIFAENFTEVPGDCAKSTPFSKIDLENPPKFALFGDPWKNLKPIQKILDAKKYPRYKNEYPEDAFYRIIISEEVEVFCKKEIIGEKLHLCNFQPLK